MMRTERSAGFVVFRRASGGSIEFLLLNYGRHWDFPKGHVEAGEDDLTAAHRELREETGITAVQLIPDFQHEATYFFRGRHKALVKKTVAFFLAETDVLQVVLSEEHVGFAYLPFAAAVKRLTYPTAREILQVAMNRLQPALPPIRGDTLS